MALDRRDELRCEAVFQGLAADVEQADRRRRHPVDALLELRVAVAPGAGVVQGLERGRRAAQDHRRVGALAAQDREVARRVAQPVLLLEGTVVLLVHDHEAERGHRQEHGRARADHHGHLTGAGAQPGAGALAVGHGGVIARHGGAEAGGKTRGELGCQADLGHQHQHLLAGGDRIGSAAQVQLGLAAAGHAFQQRHTKALTLAQDGQRSGLLDRERGRGFELRSGGRCGRFLEPGLAAAAQRTGQRRGQDFAQRVLVVRGRPAAQLQDVGRQQGLRIEHFRHTFIGTPVRFQRPRPAHGDADHLPPAEGHAQPRAGRDGHSFAGPVVENLVERSRDGHCDEIAAHSRGRFCVDKSGDKAASQGPLIKKVAACRGKPYKRSK